MKKYSIIASVVAIAATMFSQTFCCFFWFNQPKTPKCLNK